MKQTKETLEERLDGVPAEGIEHDSVNHPSHYTYGSLEVIDAIEGLELPYHLGNALKYIARAGRKDPTKTEEDLRKAIWYINRYESGMSVDNIIAMLGEKGIKSPTGKDDWSRASVATVLKNEKYAGDLRLQKYYTTDHLTHKAVKNDGSEIKIYYIKNHHTPIVDRKLYERAQIIMNMKNMRRNGATQYPFGKVLSCPYCGRTLQQKFIPVQERGKGSGWYCDCGQFVIRSSFVEDAVLKAYEKVQPDAVQSKADTAKNPDRRSAAKLMLRYKTQHPTLDKVDFFWVDDLIDHITFGGHTLTSASVLEAVRNGRESKEDRTLSVYWKCGIKSTVLSGVTKDCDNPMYVAGLLADYNKRHAVN